MLVDNKLKFDASYQDIFRKGTIAVLTTLGSGLLFGSQNMMIAFVLILGSNALALQNLRIKTVNKTLRLIAIDLIIVCLAFVASLNKWLSIPINFITLFLIIYLTVSPYNQMSYKTFMMLFVFCQYTSIPLNALPNRFLMVMVTVTIVMISIYFEQRRMKALLPTQVGEGFKLILKQLTKMEEGQFDEDLSRALSQQMNELAYVIYHTSYKRYFTTYVGKVHFHFYLNISYFNFLLEQMYKQVKRGLLSQKEMTSIKQLFTQVESYFNREISREALIEKFDSYLNRYPHQMEIEEEIVDVIDAFRKNFSELETLDYKEKNKPYGNWERSDLNQIKNKIKAQLTPKSISFNFAIRMSIVLTLTLFLAQIVGFYKFIWAIIPIMSITQPYYEDTKRRKKDRIKSNILASIGIALIINVIHVRWVAIGVLILAFYLIYAYKDYYHMSIFLTIISMSIASVSKGINALVFYRIIYVLLGAGIVELTVGLRPYKLENGIDELVARTEHLNEILERESILSLEGKESLDRVREAIIHSAVLCQKLYLKNKQYKDEKINDLISINTEFVIRLGHSILRNK